MGVDLAELIREEIAQQELSLYRIQKDTGVSHPPMVRFLNGADMYLSTASKLFDYLGLKVVRPKKGRRRSSKPAT